MGLKVWIERIINLKGGRKGGSCASYGLVGLVEVVGRMKHETELQKGAVFPTQTGLDAFHAEPGHFMAVYALMFLFFFFFFF